MSWAWIGSRRSRRHIAQGSMRTEEPNGDIQFAPFSARNYVRGYMENANDGTGEMSGDRYNGGGDEIEFEYDAVVVDGERGRRLAVVQVESMLEVVEWFSRHPSRPTTTT